LATSRLGKLSAKVFRMTPPMCRVENIAMVLLAIAKAITPTTATENFVRKLRHIRNLLNHLAQMKSVRIRMGHVEISL
jgi:hypothetical protein